MKYPDLTYYTSQITKKRVLAWSKRLLKWLLYVLVVCIAGLFFIWLIFGRSPLVQPDEISWGVTYSPLASEGFQLNSDEVYEAIVNDLRPNVIRLAAYWNRIERQPGEYDFSGLDHQVDVASEANIPVVIAVGRRVPRYPECHAPQWVDELSDLEQRRATLQFIKQTMERYDGYANVKMWQIENEPFLGSFGICPPVDEDFLRLEFELARQLTEKRIMTTESGELSFWLKASNYPDVLGTTLYRRVIVQGTNIAVNHIYPPWYYRARSNIVRMFRGNLDQVIVAELQAEPWSNVPIIEADLEDIERTMNPEVFTKNIEFTQSLGFPEVYFWGVEWWYYEKLQGNDFYWERARELFQTSPQSAD